jgi:hypothetical protein
MGFGLEIGFTDCFNTRLVTAINYSAIAERHTLQITRAHAKSFPACIVFTSHSLVTASNSGDIHLDHLVFSSSCSICTITISVGTFLFAKALLNNGCVYLLIKNPLSSSRCRCCLFPRCYPVTGLHTTLCIFVVMASSSVFLVLRFFTHFLIESCMLEM